MEIDAATHYNKISLGLVKPRNLFYNIKYRYKGLSALQEGVTMKGKWKIAAGLFVALFCILFGCERKENKAEMLILTPAVEAQTAYKESETVAEPEEERQAAEEAKREAEEIKPAIVQEESPEKEQAAVCVVHICGAVNHPGVYTLDRGSRIYQVVECAGGFREDAREDYLNQAGSISDGMKIYVPTVEETREVAWTEISDSTGIIEREAETSPDHAPEGSNGGGRININTAGESLLCTLPGVGSSKAKSIIAYREANGAYQKIEDIMNVEGIKEGLFQKIRDSITVS